MKSMLFSVFLAEPITTTTIVVALLALAAVLWAAYRIAKAFGWISDKEGAVTEDALNAVDEAVVIAQAISERGQNAAATPAECAQLKRIYERAVSGHLDGLQLSNLRNSILALCPNSDI